MVERPSESASTIVMDSLAADGTKGRQPETDEEKIKETGGDLPTGYSTAASSIAEPEPAHTAHPHSPKADVEAVAGAGDNDHWDWDTDPANPYNWPMSKKYLQVLSISASAFAA